MRRNSNNFLAFLYIVVIATSLIGTIILLTQGIKFIEITTGKATGSVGVCVGVMPVIEEIGSKTVQAGNEFYYDVNASAGTDNVTFYDNTTLFEINESTGEINFTANVSHDGLHIIAITANNTICVDIVNSTDFDLTVLTNPPVLDPIGDLNATEDTEFYYDVNASDTEDGNDTDGNLNFWTNTTMFEINITSGEINFTPTNNDVGVHRINISVNDTIGLIDFEVINFTVINANDAPVLDSIPNFTVDNNRELYEDSLFYYDVNATDIDVGDVLTFSDNTSLFSISPNTGEIEFTPNNTDVNNYSVEIYVVDGLALDIQVVLFEIIEVNDAPVLDSIGAQTIWVNDSYYYDVNATDEEDSPTLPETGNLTFWVNDTVLFDINATSGAINTSVNDSLVGSYLINVSVNDSQGAMDSEVVSFTVTTTNRAPTIDSYYPTALTPSVVQGGSLEFNITKSDPDGTIPSVKWYLDGPILSGEISDSYLFAGNVIGTYNVTVIISEGELEDAQEWRASVVGEALAGAGVGGGGEGEKRSCRELWICTDWSTCTREGIRIRICTDQHNCVGGFDKPRETEECIFVEKPSCLDGVKNQNEILIDCGGVCKLCPTCDDGIQNQGETNTDCGGPCPRCPEVEKPVKLVKVLCGDNKLSIKELITCPRDSYKFWIIIIVILIVLFKLKKIIKLVKKFGYREVIKDDEYAKRINKLIKVAYRALNEDNLSKLKVTISRIEVLYNSIKQIKIKKKVYNKIKRLNEAIEEKK